MATKTRAHGAPAPAARSDDLTPEFLARFEAARARGARALRERPHAARVHYDAAHGTLVVTLTSGAGFFVPAAQVPGLEHATAAQRAAVTLEPLGVALRWEALDVDMTVAALLRHVFDRRTLASAFGAAGGRVRSPAKAEAARANGAKGGRPTTQKSQVVAFSAATGRERATVVAAHARHGELTVKPTAGEKSAQKVGRELTAGRDKGHRKR